MAVDLPVDLRGDPCFLQGAKVEPGAELHVPHVLVSGHEDVDVVDLT
jgi:hypothetical protein